MGFSRAKTYEDDKTWAWKFVLRLLAILFNLTGIALTAWALAKSGANGIYEDYNYEYYGDDIAFIPWNLIPFSLSFIWCLTNICILLSRSYPIHPGANVGCDLFLWLAFIVTGFFSVLGAINSLNEWSYSDDGTYDSYDGESYAYYPNGTSYLVSPSNPAPPCPGFDSCAQKSEVEARIKERGIVIATASAFALLMVLVHFALFVSACRYTHQRRHNREALTEEKVKKEATVIAREIIAQMAQEGRLPPAQQPLLATEGPVGGHFISSPPPSSPALQHQHQPQIMVHDANRDDGISHVPSGQVV
ncbi:MAG: hypothetical protein Q9195_003629 [Heterodermia aff. obscurata]